MPQAVHWNAHQILVSGDWGWLLGAKERQVCEQANRMEMGGTGGNLPDPQLDPCSHQSLCIWSLGQYLSLIDRLAAIHQGQVWGVTVNHLDHATFLALSPVV